MTQMTGSKSEAFARSIGKGLADCLDALSTKDWWWDLLALWRPAGQPSESYGLRLAIRNGTMNFYRMGQSVAQVRFDVQGQPYMKIHLAYVKGGKVDEQHYVSLSDKELSSSKYGNLGDYEGIETLKKWIDNVNQHGKKGNDREKAFVDKLLAANPNVIDLEAGLPGFLKKDSVRERYKAAENPDAKVALRIDLVALEIKGDEESVVLWEAKMMSNPELRHAGSTPPDVLGQLKDYEFWIGNDQRETELALAYQQTCKFLVGIHEAASNRGLKVGKLSEIIRRVAEKAVLPRVDRRPRVVIGDQDNDQSWVRNGHARKLVHADGQEYHVQVVQGEDKRNYELTGTP